MLSKTRRVGLIVLLGLTLLGLGIKADDSVTSGSSAGNETTSSPNGLAGFSQAVLKEEITKNSDNLESSGTQPQFTDHNTLHVRVDSSGTENFSEAGQTKTIKHFITWDEDDLFGYFCMGYLRIEYSSAVVDIDHVTSGAFSTGIRRRGVGWVIVDPWLWFSEDDVPESDPNRLAFTITWKALQAGTTTFAYTVTNSSGGYRGYFLTGTVHNMQAVPAVVDFAPQIQPPAAPSNLVATAVSSSQINLTWQDNSDNEQGFIIERQIAIEGYDYVPIATFAPGTTYYSDANLVPGTVYYYRVKTYNQAGESAYSNQAHDRAFVVIQAPSDLSGVTISPLCVNLTWRDNSNNEAGFKIERQIGAYGIYQEIASVGVNVTSYSDSGLTPATDYYYRVRAYGSYSDYSNPFQITTPILSVEELLKLLERLYNEKIIDKETYNSLRKKLEATLDSFNKGNLNSAQGQLDAFIHEVEAQKGKKIASKEAATDLGSIAKTLKEPTLYIKADDGVSDPPKIIPFCHPITLKTIITPLIKGSYEWSVSPKDKIKIEGPVNQSSVVVHGIADSMEIEDITITVTFTPASSQNKPLLALPLKATVTKEKIYYFLWGYSQQTKKSIPDMTDDELKIIKPVIDKLVSMDYKIYDDTNVYNQGLIDKAFEPENLIKFPRKIIIDRNTTKANLVKYMNRRTARGVLWASHGYMEPYPSCPDDDLLKFESRVWTAQEKHPETTEVRVFVREWKYLLAQQFYLPINFTVMHSCATGGLGEEYGGEPWKYTEQATKDRVIKKYEKLPPAEELSFTIFNVLTPAYTDYIKTYNGPSYFGFGDIDVQSVISSIKD